MKIVVFTTYILVTMVMESSYIFASSVYLKYVTVSTKIDHVRIKTEVTYCTRA